MKKFADRVTEAGLLEAAQIEAVDKEAEAHVEAAVQAALKAEFPKPAELLTDVYVAY